MKVLVTCPPMIESFATVAEVFERKGVEVTIPSFTQVVSEEALISLLPHHDGWIIGDDEASRTVVEAGISGRFKAAVKWGVGTDNIDFAAFADCGVPITNTPNVFGSEVADLALGYVIALARETFQIDSGVRRGQWPKPAGISLADKTVGLIGLGDVGKKLLVRLRALEMNVVCYDPSVTVDEWLEDVGTVQDHWPNRVQDLDFIVVTCSLTKSSYHMIDARIFSRMKDGVRIVNVGRGGVIDESSLVSALESGKVYSAALDVFESEPLPLVSRLRDHSKCVFGSHNASNTVDAVRLVNEKATRLLLDFLKL